MMARPRELESRLLAIVRPAPIDRGIVSRRALAVVVVLTALLGTAAAGRAAPPPGEQPPRGEPDTRGDSLAKSAQRASPGER
ncbi:MAG: hypothetical protein ACT4P6_20720 [Gemmatimonadaceae bacterium]